MDNAERFSIQRAEKPGYWECTDNEHGIKITFKEHDFNGSQEVTILGGDTFGSMEEAMGVAKALREMTDWLSREHYKKCMPDLQAMREKMGKDIRTIRMERGMSQTDLAAAAGITIANLSRIEAGKFSVGLDTLNKIAIALGVTLKME